MIRRVVTGHDARDAAKVLFDGPAENVKRSGSGAVSTLIWCTESTPAAIPRGEDVDDLGARVLGTPPPENGTRFCVIDFPPRTTGVLHRTETLDYAVVMSGEIEMELDAQAVALRAGDVVVQRGTNHAWHNRGDGTARVAFVLVDAAALGIGTPRVRA